jgi:hypothetical protein
MYYNCTFPADFLQCMILEQGKHSRYFTVEKILWYIYFTLFVKSA